MEIVKDEAPVEEKKVIKFDPNKSYKWGPDDVFYLKGSDFGLVLNALRMIITSPEAQRIEMARKASQAIDLSLMAAVEAGLAKESEEPKK